MQHRKRARKGSGGLTYATTIAKKLAPRHGPSSSFELLSFDPAASVMTSSNAGPCDDYVQIVDDVIDTQLIDNTVGEMGAGSSIEKVYTELVWTSECEDLLRNYRERIHYSSVCPPSTDENAFSNAPPRS